VGSGIWAICHVVEGSAHDIADRRLIQGQQYATVFQVTAIPPLSFLLGLRGGLWMLLMDGVRKWWPGFALPANFFKMKTLPHWGS